MLLTVLLMTPGKPADPEPLDAETLAIIEKLDVLEQLEMLENMDLLQETVKMPLLLEFPEVAETVLAGGAS